MKTEPDVIEPNESEEERRNRNKEWLAVWITFCIFFSVWFVRKFVNGRRQLRQNFEIIENELRRIQGVMEQRQQKAIENGTDKQEGTECTSNTQQELLENDKDK